MPTSEPRVDTVAGTAQLLQNKNRIRRSSVDRLGTATFYCGTCGQVRRVHMMTDSLPRVVAPVPGRTKINEQTYIEGDLPFVIWGKCVQCDNPVTVLLYPSGDWVRALCVTGNPGGIATANTPPSVAYYFDQAARSKSAGANSAAAAMYRAAIECLLHEQGYTVGMLRTKLERLEADIENGTGDAWVRRIDPDSIGLIKSLGDGAIHPNDGDITKQEALDDDSMVALEAVAAELLHEIFEYDAARSAIKGKLQDAARRLQRDT